MGAQALTVKGIIGRLILALQMSTGLDWVGKIGMLIPSDQETETYKWLRAIYGLVKKGYNGSLFRGLKDDGFMVTNEIYEGGLEVLDAEIRRDKTGQVQMRIDDLAKRAVEHWAKLFSTLLLAGASTNCYDGQTFLDRKSVV